MIDYFCSIRIASLSLCVLLSSDGGAFAQLQSIQTLSLDGLWTGEYVCKQGTEGIAINISSNAESDYYPAIVYLYSSGNYTSSRLKYHAKVTTDNTGRLVKLAPTHWVVNRPNYAMISLRGRLNSRGDAIEGEVDLRGCQTVSIKRDIEDPSPQESPRKQ